MGRRPGRRRCCCTATSTWCPPTPTTGRSHPFSGEIQDGYVWGRGAVDMKDFDAMLLSTVRARARAGAVPDRPLVLCFTADEEAGGHQGRRAARRASIADLFEGCTRGGRRGRRLQHDGARPPAVPDRGRREGHGLDAAHRHGAAPATARWCNPDNAVTSLAAAVARIGRTSGRSGSRRRCRCCWPPSPSSPAPRRRRTTPRS